jgi:response regulator RpfG family c-di-GMP phosphodiesterase
MMGERILIIDDDHHLLSALRRQLGDSFDVTAAQGGAEALETIAKAADDPFAVAVCDMRMPGMDGIETLKRVRDASPDTVRIMLTGNADQQTAIEAINQGAIFRFYTKPCPAERLMDGLNAALAQYRLVTAERDLLEKTLAGSIKVLVDVVSINDPAAYGLSTRLREWVRILATEFKLQQRWQLDVAAMLVPLGQVSIPPELVAKRREGQALTEAEQTVFDRAPEAARNLITNIPRLGKVAEVVYLQDRGFGGTGFPEDGPSGLDIPFDARLLKILKDLAEASAGGPPTAAAFARLDKRKGEYDPQILGRVRRCLELSGGGAPVTEVEVPVAALRPGHTVLTDLRLTNGHLILAAHTQLSAPQIERLRCLRKAFQFIEPVRVRV